MPPLPMRLSSHSSNNFGDRAVATLEIEQLSDRRDTDATLNGVETGTIPPAPFNKPAEKSLSMECIADVHAPTHPTGTVAENPNTTLAMSPPAPPVDPHKDDGLASQLASLEAPYFQPYWSLAFLVTGFGAILMIWIFGWLYIGAFWNPTNRLGDLHVTVLDCDVVPPAASLNSSIVTMLHLLVPVPLATGLLSSAIWSPTSPLAGRLGWQRGTCPAAAGAGGGCGTAQQEANCVAALSEDVRQGGPWALLYFPSNFTLSYLSWFSGSGVVPPNQPPMGRYVFARGRDYSTYTYLAAVITSNLLPGLSRSLTSSLAASAEVMQRLSPAFLVSGISVKEIDLAPVRNFGQHFASYIFCVLLWLGSSFVVVSSYQFKLPSEAALLDPSVCTSGDGAADRSDGTALGVRAGEDADGVLELGDSAAVDGVRGGGGNVRIVRLSHVAVAVAVKALVAVVFMFVLMVLLCVVLWALGGGKEQWYYNPGYAIAFGWYMSWSFISVNAVLLHLIGIERFSSMTALLLILQLTSASAIMSVDLSNRFFYIGQGLPFFYGVRGFRTIFFGTMETKMYINWLVLTAYNLVFGPLGLLLVAHRVWTNPVRARKMRMAARGQSRGQTLGRQHRGGSAASTGEVVLPVVVGFA